MSQIFVLSLIFLTIVTGGGCNSEGDALNAFKTNVIDPNNALISWDPALVNPCTYAHITCNTHNSVSRVDLGEMGLSGTIVPELGQLVNLQYLELYGNNLTGHIPPQLGNLTNLVSLDLYQNRLVGPIPATLGNLRSLRFLRLNNNNLTGKIPREVLKLVTLGKLEIIV
ncbi:hypothetical protein Leryth_004583 [Lithospermum erythrorhizon]|nr:hypothetical protein Leryth_004583 [Lithospermum erythrorhizon]